MIKEINIFNDAYILERVKHKTGQTELAAWPRRHKMVSCEFTGGTINDFEVAFSRSYLPDRPSQELVRLRCYLDYSLMFLARLLDGDKHFLNSFAFALSIVITK